MEFKNIVMQVTDRVACIRMNRPEVLNALDYGLCDDLKAALDHVAGDPSIRALLLTGAGKGFCAGADLAAFRGQSGNASEYETVGDAVASAMYYRFNRVVQRLWDMPKPVIHAINGVAAGGGLGLALTADVVIAARSARFVSVFAPKLGISPDMGTTFHLQRLVGRSRALSMAMLGEPVSAEQAVTWGLIHSVVDDDQLMETTQALAKRMADGPILAFPKVREGFAHAEHASMHEQLTWEAEAQRVLCSTQDFQEGISAFLGKRPPKFEGR